MVAGLDWYSRYVLSWELDQTLAQPVVLGAVERALAVATAEIWNADQGSHCRKEPFYLSSRDFRVLTNWATLDQSRAPAELKP